MIRLHSLPRRGPKYKLVGNHCFYILVSMLFPLDRARHDQFLPPTLGYKEYFWLESIFSKILNYGFKFSLTVPTSSLKQLSPNLHHKL